MKAFIYFCLSVTVLFLQSVFAQKNATSPNVGNPILPGYFADPTIKKIGDTYYMYATTDGNGGGFGPSQVWTSKDFVNWTIQPMNWPNTHWYWAPDMTKGYDGRYYLYYSQPVELYGAVSDTPVGPWTSLAADDQAIVPNYKIPGVITLDGQTFTDDDGKIYMFWGTWGIYPEHGCAVGLLNPDMKTFARIELIPNTVAKDFFEAPIMFKRKGIYYLLYSSGHCEDHTYRVQYVKSKNGPFGPYEYPAENPILVTNADGTIHGPGHNGILEENGKHYIVYHRHNNPHSGGGFHRQVAADELLFDENGDIKNVVPTHEGIGFLGKNTRPFNDLAVDKKVSASSTYSADFKPAFAVDNNNGTLWRAANNAGDAWLQIDLAKQEKIQTVLLEMEYPTYAYQYTIELSSDGKQWQLFSDQRKNDKWASPIIANGNATARYVRLRIFNTQLVGLPRGVWNIKVYSENISQQTIWSDAQDMPEPQDTPKGDLLVLEAADVLAGNTMTQLANKGQFAGRWQADEPLAVKDYQGKRAFYFDGANRLTSSFAVPQGLAGNGAYTLQMWVNNPELARVEPLINWSKPGHDLTLASFGYGTDKAAGAIRHGGWADMGYDTMPPANQWQYIVLSFDGYMERLYVNGKLQKEQNKMLFVRTADHFTIGGLADDFFDGYVASLRLANKALTSEEVMAAFQAATISDYSLSLETADLPLGKRTSLPIFGNAVPAHTQATMQGEIKSYAGRIGLAATTIELPELDKLLATENYTAVFDVYDGKVWALLVVRKKDGKISYYRNGKPVTNLSFVKSGKLATARIVNDMSAIHSIHVRSEDQHDQDIQTTYEAWLGKTQAALLQEPLTVDRTPYRINEDQLFISLKNPNKALQYQFKYGEQASAWSNAAHALFTYDQRLSDVQAFARDRFGNVSKEAAFTLAKKAPINLPSSMQRFDFTQTKEIPFWDGMNLPSATDRMQVEVSAVDGAWRLGSKDTKWGKKEEMGPFLFKKLSCDFTIELHVEDVVGKDSGTRTSSEAGLMLQDAENPRAYINNTVLTGWNLGNLTRNIGSSIYKEANTGTGLAYESFLQIQKVGALFYLRSSKDGLHWQDLPNSPMHRPDLAEKPLLVGIYQVANNNQFGYGVFKNVKLWLMNP